MGGRAARAGRTRRALLRVHPVLLHRDPRALAPHRGAQPVARRSVIAVVVVRLRPAAPVVVTTPVTPRLPRLRTRARAALLSCSVTILARPPLTLTVRLATVLRPFRRRWVTLQRWNFAGQLTRMTTVPRVETRNERATLKRIVTTGPTLPRRSIARRETRCVPAAR